MLEDNYLTSFLDNLLGTTEERYVNLQPRPATLDELREAFLLRFRAQAFQNHLIDRLIALKMGVNENIDTYYTRLKSLLYRWHNHQMLDSYLRNAFIKSYNNNK